MGVPIHNLSLQSFCDRQFSHVRETALRLHSPFDFGALLFRYEVLIITAIPTNIYWMLSFSSQRKKFVLDSDGGLRWGWRWEMNKHLKILCNG